MYLSGVVLSAVFIFLRLYLSINFMTNKQGNKSMLRLLTIYLILSSIFIFSMQCTPLVIEKNENDANSTVEMKSGDTLEITLKANPTTGYQWVITSVDSSLLINTDTEYKTSQTSRKIVGSGGKSIFRFKAKKSGKTDLRLIYHQPFEKNIPPVKTFQLTVIVKG